MQKRYALYKYLLIGLIFVAGCATATLRTFVNPAIQPESIKSIAIFPMRNVQLLPDESREINRGISQEFTKRNPNVKIVGPADATTLINQAELADKYSDFLRDYTTSGVPNVIVLKEIGNALGVDAILQGEVFDIYQRGGSFGGNRGITSLTLRYTLLSTRNGDILWEATSNAKKETGTTLEAAPPLYEVILLARDKILTALPTLGK